MRLSTPVVPPVMPLTFVNGSEGMPAFNHAYVTESSPPDQPWTPLPDNDATGPLGDLIVGVDGTGVQLDRYGAWDDTADELLPPEQWHYLDGGEAAVVHTRAAGYRGVIPYSDLTPPWHFHQAGGVTYSWTLDNTLSTSVFRPDLGLTVGASEASRVDAPLLRAYNTGWSDNLDDAAADIFAWSPYSYRPVEATGIPRPHPGLQVPVGVLGYDIVAPGRVVGQSLVLVVEVDPDAFVGDAAVLIAYRDNGPTPETGTVVRPADLGDPGFAGSGVLVKSLIDAPPGQQVYCTLDLPADFPRSSLPVGYGAVTPALLGLPTPIPELDTGYPAPGEFGGAWPFRFEPVPGEAYTVTLSITARLVWQYQWQPPTIRWHLPDPTPGLPPTRVFPRDDGLATSSAARVYPPPKSRQGSSRRGQGSYQ